MPTLEIAASKKNLAGYGELLRRVREAMAQGRRRAQEVVEREKVRASWEVGKLIQEHMLHHQARANYGARVMERLSKDIGISKSELNRMVEFARTYAIGAAPRQLSWAHIRTLLAVNNPETRKEISERAVRQNWSSRELLREIKKLKSGRKAEIGEFSREELLVPLKGSLDTYRIVTLTAGPLAGKAVIDIGFSSYHLPPPAVCLLDRQGRAGAGGLGRGRTPRRFPLRENQIVRISKSGRLVPVQEAKEEDLFTYRAYLVEVTDADTLWMLIDLGFGFTVKEQLRLRGIDSPELKTRAGLLAKRFVEKELRASLRGGPQADEATPLIIRSSKSDKYDRYLADVFYLVRQKEHFLNNRLLKKGLAQRAPS